jgi:outer membrane lipoprotein carrier protein
MLRHTKLLISSHKLMNHRTEESPGRRLNHERQLQSLRIAVLVFVVSFGSSFASERPPIELYVKQLEASYKGVNSLRADFTQSYRWGSRTRQESGTVYFGRGGRMRWEYREPEEKLFIADNKNVLMYIPAEKQLTRSTVKASEDVRVPFRLLLSRMDLHRVFGKIEFADGALAADPGDSILRAIPKHGDDSGIHEVLLDVSPGLDIRRLEVTFTDRSVMKFEFKDLKRNAPVSPGLFQFTPPPGTQIIDQK